MTTVVKFRARSANKISNQSAGAATLLASLSQGLDLIGQTDFKSKEEIRQALYFLALSNLHLRHFVDQIKNEKSRARILAQTNRIRELVEDADRRAAVL